MIQSLASLLLLALLANISLAQRDSCNRVEYGADRKILCVCNENLCGDLKLNLPDKKGQAFIYQTTEDGKRLEMKDLGEIGKFVTSGNHLHKVRSKAAITVDLSKEQQTIMGWGGAFTDAFGENLDSLPDELSHKVIESYFGAYGLHYNFGRVPIGGTGFSSRKYTYDDLKKPDHELKYWSLTQEDRYFKIPYILEALKLSKESRNVELKLFASPWSPPAWMKTNNNLVRGHLKNDDQTYAAYAEYLMKFYDAYKRKGINFWGASVQNEPYSANSQTYSFNSLQMNNEEMIKFIGKFLGPALEKRGYTKENFKLMVGDDSIGSIHHQILEVLADEDVQKYVSGLAYHWYATVPIVSYNRLEKLYDSVKDKLEFMMMSEASTGSKLMQTSVEIGSWERAMSYAEDIIEDLSRNTSAWIDWNMALDIKGGPNWSGDYADSPILVDPDNKQFYKQPMYYSLAHFTRFFKPGSVRVDAQKQVSFLGPHVRVIAAHNKNTDHMVLTILNKSDRKEKIDITVLGLRDGDSSNLEQFIVDKKSITTVVMKI